MIQKKCHFQYGNFRSSDNHLIIASFNYSSLFENPSLGTSTIETSKSPMSMKFQIANIKNESGLSFPLSFACTKQDGFTPIEVAYIQNELTRGMDWERLTFFNDGEKNWFYYLCRMTDFKIIKTSFTGNVYEFSVNVVCDSIYAYEDIADKYTFTTEGNYIINCKSQYDKEIIPLISMTCNASGGNIKLKNKTNGHTFTISNLENGETITIDEIFIITSSIGNKYRLDDTNLDFFTIKPSTVNEIEVSGNFSNITIKYNNCYKVGV